MRNRRVMELIAGLTAEEKDHYLLSLDRRVHRGRLLAWLVLGLLFVLFFGGIGVRAYYQGQILEQRARQAELQKKIQLLQTRLTAADQNIAALVQRRIPSLIPLQPNQDLELDQGYVHSIRFQPVNARGDTTWRYQLTFQNRGQKMINPVLTVGLYDELGVQVGLAQLSAFKTPTLLPGDTKSQSGPIELNALRPARYFRINLKD